MDEFDELVAEDHLAGSVREIDAELEGARVHLADAQGALAGLDVLGHHLEAAHKVSAALLKRHAQELGIRSDEIRRRERGGHLAQIELRLVALVRVHFVGAALSRELSVAVRNLQFPIRAQAAVAARHVPNASSRRTRSVWRDVRWRWTLNVLWTAA